MVADKSKTRSLYLIESEFISASITDFRHFSPLLPTLSQDHTGFESRRQVDNVWIVSKDLEKIKTPAHGRRGLFVWVKTVSYASSHSHGMHIIWPAYAFKLLRAFICGLARFSARTPT